MQKLSRFIVTHRNKIFVLFVLLAVVCTVMATHVAINGDMTKYLPEEMRCKIGQDIMTREFDEVTQFSLMVEGIPQDERQQFATELNAFSDISSVDYEEDSSEYNNGSYALYQITGKGGSYSDDAGRTYDEICGACESRGYDYWVESAYIDAVNKTLGPFLVIAVAIAMVILFVLAASWIEPVLLLITIVIAVLINLGTNLIFGSVSATTNNIGAILQMALSMDYLIMLLNRYRRELQGTSNRELAMERALTGGVKAIASSSVTTIAGLLCLVLMSFTIGRDMGLVLAKGVFLSLICAFACLPCLVLACDDLMRRTAKRHPEPQMKALSAFSYKLRFALVIVFVLLFAGGWILKSGATASFFIPSENPDRAAIQERFPMDSQVVILYDISDQEQAEALVPSLEQLENVSTVQSYGSTLGKQQTAEEMAEETGMDAGLLRVLYYDCKEHGATTALTASELGSYIRTGLAEDMGDFISSDQQSMLDDLAGMVEGNMPGGTLTADQAVAALSSHPSIHEDMLRLIYLCCSASKAYDSSWTLSTDELMSFLKNDVLEDPLFADMITGSAREGLLSAVDQVEAGRNSMLSPHYGRIILGCSCEDESPEMEDLVAQLDRTLPDSLSDYYLVGQGPMAREMADAFPGELGFITLVTIIAIMLIVLVTFRSIAIPIILVALIQSAFCWDMALSAFMGKSIYYVAMLVVQSILMGATIDYAILYTTNYREARKTLPVREAIGQSYRHSIHTVMMSGSILVFVCLLLGLTSSGITGQICLVISEGAAAAVILVLLVLPGTLAALDKLVTRKSERFEG